MSGRCAATASRVSLNRVTSNSACVSAMISCPAKIVCNARPSCPPAPAISIFIRLFLNREWGVGSGSRILSPLPTPHLFLFKPRQDVHQLPQRFRRHIFLRQDRRVNLFERPIDLQVGVVPLHADLALRVVKIVAFVYDLRGLAGDAEAVSEPRRDVNLAEVFSRQPDADPLPEVWRAAPNVDRHVVDLALDHANQFALRPAKLRVQPAYRASLRPRMVVLDEDRVNPALLILTPVIGFEEEASLVAEDLRLDDDHTGNVRGNEFHHVCAPCSNILSKYLP